MNSEKKPRGLRNNNPLNIRVGNNWQGEVEKPTDSQFEQFTSMTNGCRAAFILLRRYINERKYNTIRKIVTHWAPSSENNTNMYIKVVSRYSGIDADTPLSFQDLPTMYSVFQGMCFVENGVEIPEIPVLRGYFYACTNKTRP